jgi:hypothetical protein
MAFDLGTIVHTPNRWLETRLRYEGRARAEFANPKGAIEGPAVVSFGPDGKGSVVIDVERIDASDPTAFSLQASSSQPQDYGTARGVPRFSRDFCEDLRRWTRIPGRVSRACRYPVSLP